MSKMIKAIKQVSAVAASTLLLSSSAFANLGNYGSNFVKDGKFSGQVVVGTMTGADDVSAANVVIADLKSKYTTYRQALRDITDTYDSYLTVVWPDKP